MRDVIRELEASVQGGDSNKNQAGRTPSLG